MQLPDYIELSTADVAASKAFFTAVFGVSFTDYGPEYAAIHSDGIDIGLIQNRDSKPPLAGYQTDDLEQALADVVDGGGTIVQDIFAFPGGRRFHFTEPGGNELMIYQADE